MEALTNNFNFLSRNTVIEWFRISKTIDRLYDELLDVNLKLTDLASRLAERKDIWYYSHKSRLIGIIHRNTEIFNNITAVLKPGH